MLNAINWNAGIDQIEKQQETIYRGSQGVGSALAQSAQFGDQRNARAQQMAVDGLKFYAEYDQREDAARRDQSRLDLEKTEAEQRMKFEAEMNPLRVDQARNTVEKQKDDIDWERRTREVEAQKLTREEEQRRIGQAAVVEDWEKKNRTTDPKRLIKDGDGLPPNWEQMTPEAKYAYATAKKGLGAEEMEAREKGAKIRSTEAKATSDEVAATKAPEVIEAGLAATRAGTAATIASTEKTKTEMVLAGVKAAGELAGKGKSFDLDAKSGGMAQYTPVSEVDKDRAKKQEETFKKADEKSIAFATSQRSDKRINEILFGTSVVPENGWTDAQKEAAHKKVTSAEFATSAEAKELAAHTQSRALAQRAMLGGGPLTNDERGFLLDMYGNPGAATNLGDWANVAKQFNSRSYLDSFVTRSKNDEESARKSVAVEQGKDLSFIDGDKQTRLRWRMAGENVPYDKFAEMPIDKQSRLAFGEDWTKEGGTSVGKPRWMPTEESLYKYQRYQDFQSGDAQRTEKYRPAQQVEALNPFAGTGADTAARAYEVQNKSAFLASAPPKVDQPIANANGTIVPPGKQGNVLVTPNLNGDYSTAFSRATGQPILATPRPVQAEERLSGYGYTRPQETQSRIRSSFK